MPVTCAVTLVSRDFVAVLPRGTVVVQVKPWKRRKTKRSVPNNFDCSETFWLFGSRTCLRARPGTFSKNCARVCLNDQLAGHSEVIFRKHSWLHNSQTFWAAHLATFPGAHGSFASILGCAICPRSSFEVREHYCVPGAYSVSRGQLANIPG